MKYSVDTEELVRMYENGMTSRQIGEILDIPYRTILRYLNAAGVQMRNPGNPATPELQDAGWLESEYVKKRKSTTEIAAEIGCSSCAVAVALKRAGIPARSTGSEKGHDRNTVVARQKMSEAKQGVFIGPNNPNWKGGIAFIDPERNRAPAKMWVKAIKDRDEWECVECGASEKLHAHHIKSWRHHPELRYDMDNGITLCEPCHIKAHGKGAKYRWPQVSKNPHERVAS